MDIVFCCYKNALFVEDSRKKIKLIFTGSHLSRLLAVSVLLTFDGEAKNIRLSSIEDPLVLYYSVTLPNGVEDPIVL